MPHAGRLYHGLFIFLGLIPFILLYNELPIFTLYCGITLFERRYWRGRIQTKVSRFFFLLFFFFQFLTLKLYDHVLVKEFSILRLTYLFFSKWCYVKWRNFLLIFFFRWRLLLSVSLVNGLFIVSGFLLNFKEISRILFDCCEFKEPFLSMWRTNNFVLLWLQF